MSLLFAGSICDGFCKNNMNYGRRFYPCGIKPRPLSRYPGRFGPGSSRLGHFGLSNFGQFFVVLSLIGGSFRPDF